MKRKPNIALVALFVTGLLLSIPGFSSAAPLSQSDKTCFNETGKCVPAIFYAYWQTHGGLSQQGFPVSDAANEQNATDGKTYLTQYFERAVFEYHPENAAPNNVLLSLVGRFRFQDKYAGGAGETYTFPNSQRFNETGFNVGGPFLAYWKSHGGLSQQGFPISPVFQEKSDVNGQTYYVQYFERAQFEWHQDNAGGPNEILLSLLGRMRYDKVHGNGGPQAGDPPPANTAVANTCPNGKSVNATVEPGCGKAGTTFNFTVSGFQINEALSFWITNPRGDVVGSARPFDLGSHGSTFASSLDGRSTSTLTPGQWAITFQGKESGNQAIVFFYITN